MGFSSYDDLISKLTAGKRLTLPYCKLHSTNPVAMNWYHLWYVQGSPGQGPLYTGTALEFQRTTDVTAGALYHGGNKSPETKHLISMSALATAGATPPIVMLVDMVGYYPLTQSASQQDFDNTNGPNRYVSSGDPGLQISLIAAAAGGSTASNLSVLNYVDQDGNAGTIPTSPAIPVTVSAAAPTTGVGARVLTTMGGPFLPLAEGDCGVRSLTSVTFSAANTGLEAFVLVKPLAVLPCPAAGVPAERDFVMQLANLERVYDGACLTFIVFFPVATAATIQGTVDVAWG